MKAIKMKNSLIRKPLWAGLIVSALAALTLGTGTTYAQNTTATLPANGLHNAPADFFGFNGENRLFTYPGAPDPSKNPWTNATFLANFAALKPRTLRFPGGTVANYWDWYSGWFIPGPTDNNIVHPNGNTGVIGQPYNANGQFQTVVYRDLDLDNAFNKAAIPSTLDDLKTAWVASNKTFKPIFVLNMLTQWKDNKTPLGTLGPLDYQIEMLKKAKSLGLPVEYIELGNEFYIGGPGKGADNTFKYPSNGSSGEFAGYSYGKDLAGWVRAVSDAFPASSTQPALKFAVIGKFYKPGDNARGTNWNSGVRAALLEKGITPDAFTFHYYIDPNSLDYQHIFADAFSKWDNAKAHDLNDLPPNVNAWITEFSLINDQTPADGTWAHGLVNASFALLFPESRKVLHMLNHAATGSAQFAALFDSTNSLNYGPVTPTDYYNVGNLNQGPPATAQWGKSASGIALSFVAEMVYSKNSISTIDFTNNADIPVDFGGGVTKTYRPYVGLVWQNNLGLRKAVMVNLSSSSRVVNVSALFPSGGTYKTVQGNNQAKDYGTGIFSNSGTPQAARFNFTDTSPTLVTPANFPTNTVNFTGANITLPPFSIAAISGNF